MTDNSVIIKTDAVTKKYDMGAEIVHALRGISLEIHRGTYVSIMGPSGSGKSTFFNMIGGLDQPSTGDVFMEGQRLRDLSSGQMAWIRCHKIGFIFQSFNLIPTMSALDNVAMPRIFPGVTPLMRGRTLRIRWNRLGWGIVCTICLRSYPAGSSSVWPLPAP
ncbi:MAG: ABC transporter ATP-binding protein [Kiritimatiellia bacterium]